MSLVTEATYRYGVLEPDAPLPLEENQRVTVAVRRATPIADGLYGLLQWPGDHESLRRIAEDDDHGDEVESP